MHSRKMATEAEAGDRSPDREPVRRFTQTRWPTGGRGVTTRQSRHSGENPPMPIPPLIVALAMLSASPTPDAVSARTPQAPPPVAAASDTISFARYVLPDGTAPAIEAGIWAPRDLSARLRPLVVISHGTGGDFRSHHDTAEALARAGFIVAALTHGGDNWRDRSRTTDMAGRSRQLSVLIDYMLDTWEGRAAIDPKRIGAFGFSAGAFTVLIAAGGTPDLTRVAEHCRLHPAFYDCKLMAAHPARAESARWIHDTRITAIVAAAPALGFTFTRRGLVGVTQPVQLWQAGADRVLPAPWYAEPVRDALPGAPEFHDVAGADHFDFLPPCAAQLAAAAPVICAATPGFDRAAFHERFNREVTRFLLATL